MSQVESKKRIHYSAVSMDDVQEYIPTTSQKPDIFGLQHSGFSAPPQILDPNNVSFKETYLPLKQQSQIKEKPRPPSNVSEFTFANPQVAKQVKDPSSYQITLRPSEVKNVLLPCLDEPSYIKEYKESNSVYHIPAKREDSEISSDGEFNDANKMQVYKEDATEVYLIE